MYVKKGKLYYARFPTNTIREAFNLFTSKCGGIIDKNPILTVKKNNTTWNYDTVDEWLSDYPDADYYHFYHTPKSGYTLNVSYLPKNIADIQVSAPTRAELESIFQVFERDLPSATIRLEQSVAEQPKPIKIFIGHGHDPQWRDLKDHLHEQHGLDVIAYEIGPRAGLTIKEVLEGMLNESSIAFLVLTGEDITTDGEAHARENVIHEVGLFQGRLSFKRSIVLLEKGCHEFSNILGINQIRFSKGNIKEVYGDVLATIKREFGQQKD